MKSINKFLEKIKSAGKKKYIIIGVSIFILIVGGALISLNIIKDNNYKRDLKNQMEKCLKSTTLNEYIKGNDYIIYEGYLSSDITIPVDSSFKNTLDELKWYLLDEVYNEQRNSIINCAVKNHKKVVSEKLVKNHNITIKCGNELYSYNYNGLLTPNSKLITKEQAETKFKEVMTEVNVISYKNDGDYDYIEGFIYNNSNRTINYYEVYVDFMSSNGNILNTDYTNSITLVKPHAKQKFHIMSSHCYETRKYKAYIKNVQYQN